MTGGGFGGCAVALVDAGGGGDRRARDRSQAIRSATGTTPDVWPTGAGAGVGAWPVGASA